MPICHSCNESFADFEALALHISSSKKGHRKGRKWAAKYLTKVNKLNQKQSFLNKTPLTKEDRENRANLKRELSGNFQYVNTLCPSCKNAIPQKLPIEFIQSVEAWRTKEGTLRVCCLNCQKT